MNEGAEAKGKFQSFRVSDGSPEIRFGEISEFQMVATNSASEEVSKE